MDGLLFYRTRGNKNRKKKQMLVLTKEVLPDMTEPNWRRDVLKNTDACLSPK